MTDTMSCYVSCNFTKGRATSRLEHYGYQHFWLNQVESFVHEKFSFVHTNNLERMWRSVKSTFTQRLKLAQQPWVLKDYLHSHMLKQLLEPDITR
jgi:hypothetical protein